jgi:hypothetical protein
MRAAKILGDQIQPAVTQHAEESQRVPRNKDQRHGHDCGSEQIDLKQSFDQHARSPLF